MPSAAFRSPVCRQFVCRLVFFRLIVPLPEQIVRRRFGFCLPAVPRRRSCPAPRTDRPSSAVRMRVFVFFRLIVPLPEQIARRRFGFFFRLLLVGVHAQRRVQIARRRQFVCRARLLPPDRPTARTDRPQTLRLLLPAARRRRSCPTPHTDRPSSAVRRQLRLVFRLIVPLPEQVVGWRGGFVL